MKHNPRVEDPARKRRVLIAQSRRRGDLGTDSI
jgi:hypothetical protein